MSSCAVCLSVVCVCPPPKIILIKQPAYPAGLALILVIFLAVAVDFGNDSPAPPRNLSDALPGDYRGIVPAPECASLCAPIASTQNSSANTVTVVANAVNIRSSPSLNAPVIGVLSRNAIAEVATGVAAPSDWIPIVLPNTSVGFVLREYLR
jgi:Bacterial SH3 domain